MVFGLLGVAFVDELVSGIAPATTPDVAAFLGISGGTAAGAMLFAFHALAALVEAPLLAWSERVSARWFSSVSLAVVALAAFAAAVFPTGAVMLLALAVYGPASGCALAAAEGLVVEAEPEGHERVMARFALAANAGDLAVPVLLAILGACHLGFRSALAISGAVALALAVAHAASRSLDRKLAHHDEEDSAPTIREALRVAFATRSLLGWSFAAALTNLLDEVLVAFTALHLHAMGATTSERSWALAAWVLGGFVGLAALERLATGATARRLLFFASLLTLLEVVALAIARSPYLGIAASFAIGVTGSTLHPLTKARAYASLPHRPALVNAVASTLLPFDMAAPVALGFIAARFGPAWAVAAIAIAPVGVIIAALRRGR
ncbi:MAG: MFS transporter [Polyangiales bacterium]